MGGDHSQVNTCEDDSIPMFCSVTTNFYSCSYTWRSDEKWILLMTVVLKYFAQFQAISRRNHTDGDHIGSECF